jgi:hypothetical protein
MQGGGSDPEVSLLQGGNSANIIPLKGGRRTLRARPKGANTTPKQRIEYPTVATIVFSLPPEVSKELGKKKKGGLKKKSLVGGAATDPVVVNTEVLGEAVDPLPDLTGEFNELADDYKDKTNTLWNRYSISKDNAILISRRITRTNYRVPAPPYSEKGEGGFDRLAVVLLKSVNNIVVFPQVKGDENIFSDCLEFIDKNRFDDDDNRVIIFPPPFFGRESAAVNQKLFSIFMKLKNGAKASIYLLTENTAFNRVIGHGFGDEAMLNMCEPTYIVYPFPRTFDSDMKGGILFSGAAADESDIPKSNIGSVKSVSDFISAGKQGPIAFPPNLKSSDILNKTMPYKIYRFFGDSPTIIDPDNVIIIQLKKEYDTAKQEASIQSLNAFSPTDDDHLSLDNVKYTTLKLGYGTYSIRKPTDAVKNDWLNLKFTKSEVDLLTKMNLRPSYLQDIFGKDVWKDQLKVFLANMVNSKCFIDRALLTTAECSRSSEFVDRVAEYFLIHDDRLVELHQDHDAAMERYRQKLLSDAAYAKGTAVTESESASLKAQKEIERITALAASLGIDTKLTPEQVAKDPFVDGRITKVDKATIVADDEITKNIATDLWHKEFYVIKKSGKTIQIGELSTKAEDQDDAVKAIQLLLTALEKDYPAWLISD